MQHDRSGARLFAGLAGPGALGFWALRRRRDRRRTLAGQVAIVTGGSRGLGRLVAEELARQGCRVAIPLPRVSRFNRAFRRVHR